MNFLTRLRGLQAPVALDEPLRLQDGFPGASLGAGSGQTIIVSRDRAQRREPHRAPGGGTSSSAASSSGSAGPTILIARNMRDVRRQANRAPGSPFTIPASGVTAGTYNTANITVGADGRVTAAANGTVVTAAAPGLIPDLCLWWESDDILGAPGALITRIRERTPWITGVAGGNSSGTVKISSSQLNSLNTLVFPSPGSAVNGTFPLLTSLPLLATATIFVVVNGSTATGTQAILGGTTSGGLALYLVGTTGTAKIALCKTQVSVLTPSTATWTPGSWFQANATYVSSTGAYAYRQARAAAGSGTSTTGAGSAATTTIGEDGGASPLNGASLAAVIVYNRVLTSTEITNVETYLNTKWGV